MKLFRISGILSLGLAAFLGFLLFSTSQAVQDKEAKLSEVRKKLNQETEAVRVLSLEWDYLNRPQRLEQLAKEIGMKKINVSEMVRSVRDIPEPIIVHTDSQFYEEGISHMIAVSPNAVKRKPAPVASPERKEAVVLPSTAERQDFDRLIETLSRSNGGAVQ